MWPVFRLHVVLAHPAPATLAELRLAAPCGCIVPGRKHATCCMGELMLACLQTNRVPLTLTLTYKFSLPESGKVTPKLPLLNK